MQNLFQPQVLKQQDGIPPQCLQRSLATLVANKVYADPYYGTNINNIPGLIENRGREMPDSSPFKVAWWYRTEFKVPAAFKNKHTWLKFHSINYKANIWVNGKLIADTTSIEGAYRLVQP